MVFPVYWARRALAVTLFGAIFVLVGETLADTEGTTPVVYVSPSGQDSNSCSAGAPCATFKHAFQVASPGNVVQVADGRYPAQTLDYDATKTSPDDVVFQPAPGASVSLAGFSAGNLTTGQGAKHFELRDLKIAGEVKITLGTEDVTLRNLDAGSFNLTSTRQVRIYGGDWGPLVNNVNHIKGRSEDILIDGALFHDYTISDPAKHAECLHVWPGRRVTIRNSTFRNCTDFDILVRATSPGSVPGEITIENSFFDEPMPGATATVQCVPGCPRGGNALAFSDSKGYAWSGVAIRHSSLLGGIRVDPAISNVFIKGNVGRKDLQSSCQRQASFAYNVWNGAACSATDRRAALADVFVGPTSDTFDLRLKAGSPAIGAGDPADHPERDIKGRLRPAGLAPDAGAWQREPALVVVGRAIGTATIGMRSADVIEFYGNPRRRTTEKLTDGAKIDVFEHTVRGGKLRVSYRDDVVVAIATTSPYYRTLKGLTPGTPMKARAEEDRTCRPVGAPKGKARLYLRPTRSKSPVVAEVIVVAARIVPACATAPNSR